jgi:hypothetical protein
MQGQKENMMNAAKFPMVMVRRATAKVSKLGAA